jgi:hypothetical protein
MHLERVWMSDGYVSWALVEDNDQTAREVTAQEAKECRRNGIPVLKRSVPRAVEQFENFFADTIG